MSALSGAGSSRRWRRLRALVLDRDGHRCQLPAAGDPGRLCGALATHVDHITPRAAGGGDDPANLRAACAWCNLRRGAGRDLPASSPAPAGRWRW